MQPTIALRDAIVATILLSPAFITGLALPWNFHDALATRTSVLSGGTVDALVHEVRAHKESSGDNSSGQSDAETADGTPTFPGMPTGGASGFPRPTGGFGGFGGGDGCGSGALPSGTGSPLGQGAAMNGKAKKSGLPYPSGAMPTFAPTGCGGFGAGPTGQARPTGGFFRS